MVDAFFQHRSTKAFWFSPGLEAQDLRRKLVSLIEAADLKGLDKFQYAYEPLKTHLEDDAFQAGEKIVYERLYTDVAISFLRDLQRGKEMDAMVNYDEFSHKYNQRDNVLLLELMTSVSNASSLERMVATLEPSTKEYELLSEALKQAIDSKDYEKIAEVSTALNCYRWIGHFGFNKYIIVNVPSATLQYIEGDSVLEKMKIVAGAPATPTPRFAAHCDAIVLYPYWHVPNSIAVKEILPAVKKAPGLLAFLNMQVIDKKGKIIDPATINWSAYNRKNLPYRFRQSTGCDNALGVIKFNLSSPFNVYLHDTNMKSAFAAEKRYLSHGCIRIEKPVALANFLLKDKIDDQYLAACMKNQKPVEVVLAQPIPVFVIYLLATVEDDRVMFYDDIYELR